MFGSNLVVSPPVIMWGVIIARDFTGPIVAETSCIGIMRSCSPIPKFSHISTAPQLKKWGVYLKSRTKLSVSLDKIT